MSKIIHHSVSIRGHNTSVSMEPEFWWRLKQLAQMQQTTLAKLISRIAETYPDNLSAVLRVFVLEHEAERWAASVPRKDPWLRLNVSRAACGIPQGQRAGRG